MYAIPRRKMRGIPRRKSKRLSKLDESLQALEHAGSPSTKEVSGRSEGLADRPMRGGGEEVRGKGKGKMETPAVSLFPHTGKSHPHPSSSQETKSYRTIRTQITPYARSSPRTRASRPCLRAFLDTSSPLYESPYLHRRQAQLHPSSLSSRRSSGLFAKLDSSSPLVERRRQASAHPQTPRLDIANPLYTLRPRGGVSTARDDWMNRKKGRWGLPSESGL